MHPIISKIRDRVVKKGVGHFEIYLKESRGASLEVKNRKVDTIERHAHLGFGLRILHKKRMGFAYGTDGSSPSIRYIVDRAFEGAKQVTVDPSLGWGFGASQYPTVDNWDPHIHRLNNGERHHLASQMEQAAMETSSRVKRVRYATFSDSEEEVYLVNSDGLDLFHRQTFFGLSIMAVAEKGSESEGYYDQAQSPFLLELDPVTLGGVVGREACAHLGAGRIASYRGPMLLTPKVAGEVLEVLAPSTLIENVHKKNSYLIGKKGSRVYSSCVSLVDDGLNQRGCNSSPFDAEGTPRGTTWVVQKGILKHFLYNAYWARHDGAQSTGNASREDPLSVPTLAVSNFYLVPGSRSQELIFNEMHRGAMITEVIGMHTADPVSGDFSVGAQGFLVAHGKRKKPFRSVAFTGNIHDLMCSVREVGSDLKFYGDIGSPSLLVSEASISGEGSNNMN